MGAQLVPRSTFNVNVAENTINCNFITMHFDFFFFKLANWSGNDQSINGLVKEKKKSENESAATFKQNARSLSFPASPVWRLTACSVLHCKFSIFVFWTADQTTSEDITLAILFFKILETKWLLKLINQNNNCYLQKEYRTTKRADQHRCDYLKFVSN